MAVRLEKVVLDLDDRFSGPATRAAGAAALLHREVEGINTAGRDVDRSLSRDAVRGIDNTAASARKADASIDKFSGRVRILAEVAAALGPALVPIGAAAIPAVAGLAAQMGFAATAAGVSVLAFQGVGTALDALNKYQLDPSADNFAAMQEAMSTLGPAGRDFVRTLQDLRPEMQGLQDIAQAGMFPGMTEGINEAMELMPQVEDLVGTVSSTIGDLMAEAGENLNDQRWVEFFQFLNSEARPTLTAMGQALGNVVEGLASMMMDLDPLSDMFTGGMLDAARSFREWADGLSESQGFQEFLDYVATNGPRAWDALGSIANALLQIIEAAAPIGAVSLPIIEALADTIAAIADSPAGPMLIAAAAGLSAVSRAVALYKVASGLSMSSFLSSVKSDAPGAGAAARTTAAGLGILALSMTDLDDRAGVSNMAMGALLGTMVLPGWGTAVGAAAGGMMDLAAANDEAADAIERANRAASSDDLAAMAQARSALVGERDNGWGFLSFIPDPKTSEINRAIAGLDDSMEALRGGAGGLSDMLRGPLVGGLELTADEFTAATSSAQEFRTAMAAAFGLLDRSDALIAARDAVRNFHETLRDAPRDMRKGTAAYDEVRGALNDVARSSLEAAEHLRGMERVNFLDRMRGQFISAARAMDIPIGRARHLATQLGLLDRTVAEPTTRLDDKDLARKVRQGNLWLADLDKKHPEPTIGADNRPAKGKVDEANAWLSVLGRRATNPKINVSSNAAAIAAQTNSDLNSIQDEEVWITTRRRGTGMGAVSDADGGTIPGARWPYSDKVFAHLAPGEEVISNRFGQADRHRELLKAINANRYADGGTVGGSWGGSSGSHTRVERIVETRTIVLDAGELGEMVFDTVDGRVGDFRQHDALNAGTKWAGVTSD